MWPLPVFGGWVDRREEQIKMSWGGGAASWGEPAAQAVSGHDDRARLTLIFWLQRCAKAMNRPACFASTKVPQAGQDPKAKSCETGLSSFATEPPPTFIPSSLTYWHRNPLIQLRISTISGVFVTEIRRAT
jgi:hypothetical protein